MDREEEVRLLVVGDGGAVVQRKRMSESRVRTARQASERGQRRRDPLGDRERGLLLL